MRRGHAAVASLAVMAAGALLSGWGRAEPPVDHMVVTIHTDQQYQAIHSFAASDAWSIQFLGKYWPDSQRDRAADLLFSTKMRADGSPVGIGLSAYRFEIGAGSAAPGDSSRISDRWRRATGFLQRGGSYDWSQQAGQRAFMRAAKARGVNTFIGFVNSPPTALTRNGRANSSGGDSANIAPARYAEYAKFLANTVVELERRDGIRLDYLSPFNEPQWDWLNGQEGSPWRVDEMAAMTRTLSSTLLAAHLPTRISLGESGRMNFVYEKGDKPTRGEQVQAWFGRGSPSWIGDLPNVVHAIASHSYHTTYPRDTLRAVRTRLHAAIMAVDPSLQFWQTEYCVLETTPLIRGRGRDSTIDAALYIAGIIHADMVYAQASAWHWWIAVTPYDFKDGLIYMDRDTLTGTVRDTKMLWAMGHFSRFVRPGMRRIGVDVTGPGADSTDAELQVSAYRDPSSGNVVTVLSNRSTVDREVALRGARTQPMRIYRTTNEPGVNLSYSGIVRPGGTLRMPGRSLATLVTVGVR
ncbi:MAG: xylanase [Gemmatimonadota bacterium]|nr:xylanase [Gemmatimonadota bacterium]